MVLSNWKTKIDKQQKSENEQEPMDCDGQLAREL